MSIDLTVLERTNRLLFSVELRPIQTDRFQPTGFPSLGAATYQAGGESKLLVESAQSMANRLELTCWDLARNAPAPALEGISHVTVTRKGKFLTDTILEAHRLNSPYILENKLDPSFHNKLSQELGALEKGPIDRKQLAEVLLRYDIGSLIHGVFIAKKELAGGRLRVARALSAFIEATGVRVAASGGVKNDHVNPSGDAKDGFGNVPFARDEFTADQILLHANLDLGQIRGYALGSDAEQLLVLLALYKLRKLLDGDLRLRTACDLERLHQGPVRATRPENFELPPLVDIEGAVGAAIAKCRDSMTHQTVTFEAELKNAKESKQAESKDGDEAEDGEDENED
ncbi:MAG: type I-U CRISPR-associated protein Cas7 [Polyangiaceae bacterium]|nr:type I-U CRISPR-associated protein Cas7 [Polyangiaceae bacterium]